MNMNDLLFLMNYRSCVKQLIQSWGLGLVVVVGEWEGGCGCLGESVAFGLLFSDIHP